VITANTNSFKIPVVDVDTMTGPTANFGGVSMQIVNDGTAATEGQPAFKQITATPFLFRGHTQVSNEWLRDTGSLGGEQMLMKMFSDAMGLVSFYYSTNGSGAGEPEGYINAGFKKNTAARATASSFEDTDAHMMIAGLHPNHDPARTFWCVSNAVGSKILAISDKNNYIVDPRVALKPGYIGAMYGFPVYINQHGPAANTTGDVALIDGSTCFIVRGAAPTIAASDQFAFTSGLITYRYEYREDQRFCQDAVTTWPNSTTTSGVVLLLTK
jgi:HK97 family phage major capsid protein